jgi:hypothetical protein
MIRNDGGRRLVAHFSCEYTIARPTLRRRRQGAFVDPAMSADPVIRFDARIAPGKVFFATDDCLNPHNATKPPVSSPRPAASFQEINYFFTTRDETSR